MSDIENDFGPRFKEVIDSSSKRAYNLLFHIPDSWDEEHFSVAEEGVRSYNARKKAEGREDSVGSIEFFTIKYSSGKLERAWRLKLNEPHQASEEQGVDTSHVFLEVEKAFKNKFGKGHYELARESLQCQAPTE